VAREECVRELGQDSVFVADESVHERFAVGETPGRTEPLTLAEVERAYILRVMEQVKGNKSEAAKVLGITRQTLRKKLTEAG
jgi:DNA-binding protein Fis